MIDHKSDQPLTCATCATPDESRVQSLVRVRGKFNAGVISQGWTYCSWLQVNLDWFYPVFIVWWEIQNQQSENYVWFQLISCLLVGWLFEVFPILSCPVLLKRSKQCELLPFLQANIWTHSSLLYYVRHYLEIWLSYIVNHMNIRMQFNISYMNMCQFWKGLLDRERKKN